MGKSGGPGALECFLQIKLGVSQPLPYVEVPGILGTWGRNMFQLIAVNYNCLRQKYRVGPIFRGLVVLNILQAKDL